MYLGFFIMQKGKNSASVSYTHLDVYKRQTVAYLFYIAVVMLMTERKAAGLLTPVSYTHLDVDKRQP